MNLNSNQILYQQLKEFDRELSIHMPPSLTICDLLVMTVDLRNLNLKI